MSKKIKYQFEVGDLVIGYQYEIGDRVVVRSDLEEDKVYGNDDAVGDMIEFAGKEVTISGRVEEADYEAYYLEEDPEMWNWTPEMFD